MKLDKTTFLLFTSALSVGAIGCEVHTDAPPAPRAEATASASAPAPATSQELAARKEREAEQQAERAAPTCSDDVAVVEECPAAIGPTDEGVCAGGFHWASKRCADFKSAFKPRVAQAAVACLRGLKGAAACDPQRAHLCGHQALMQACTDGAVPRGREPGVAWKATEPASSAPSMLVEQCDSIVASSATTVPAASFADCHRTMSGMTAMGRASMVACMKDHAGDKGLLGCEAVTLAAPLAGG